MVDYRCPKCGYIISKISEALRYPCPFCGTIMVRVEEGYPGKVMEELREKKKGGPSPELRELLKEALRDEESGYSLYSKIHDTILSEGIAGWAELDELDRIIDKILVQEYEHMEALKIYMRKWQIIP